MTTSAITCPHCGHVNRPGAVFCEAADAGGGGCGTYLVWDQSPGEAPPATRTAPPADAPPPGDPPPPAAASAPTPAPPPAATIPGPDSAPAPTRASRTAVQVGLSLEEPAVEPGREVTCTIRVRNVGTIVDRFVLDVSGAAAAWSILDPVELSLYPGTEGTAALRLSPPRSSDVPAGFAPIVVRATSTSDRSVAAVGEAAVEIRPFLIIEANLVPRTSNGTTGADHRLVVENSGNRPVELEARGSDPDDLLGLRIDPPVLRVGPGQTVTAAVRLHARRPVPPGPAQPRPFTVQLEGPPGAEWNAGGVFLQEPEPPPPPSAAGPGRSAAPAGPAGAPPRRAGGLVMLILLWVLLVVAVVAVFIAVLLSMLQGFDDLSPQLVLIMVGLVAAVVVLIRLIHRAVRRRTMDGRPG